MHGGQARGGARPARPRRRHSAGARAAAALPRAALLLLLLLLGLCLCARAAAAAPSPSPPSSQPQQAQPPAPGAPPLCQSQPGLKLDAPRPPARGALPFCDQFTCSCCNATHALGILRAYARAADDADMSAPCKRALALLACRPCDPEVGTGTKPSVCRGTCDSVFDACREVRRGIGGGGATGGHRGGRGRGRRARGQADSGAGGRGCRCRTPGRFLLATAHPITHLLPHCTPKDYFAFSESTGAVVPCGSAAAGGALVCSHLQEQAVDGREYCEAAGGGGARGWGAAGARASTGVQANRSAAVPSPPAKRQRRPPRCF
jgi:hypothetical protein